MFWARRWLAWTGIAKHQEQGPSSECALKRLHSFRDVWVVGRGDFLHFIDVFV
jgi:hypothetical protein